MKNVNNYKIHEKMLEDDLNRVESNLSNFYKIQNLFMNKWKMNLQNHRQFLKKNKNKKAT